MVEAVVMTILLVVMVRHRHTLILVVLILSSHKLARVHLGLQMIAQQLKVNYNCCIPIGYLWV